MGFSTGGEQAVIDYQGTSQSSDSWYDTDWEYQKSVTAQLTEIDVADLRFRSDEIGNFMTNGDSATFTLDLVIK